MGQNMRKRFLQKHASPVLVAAVDPFDVEAALHQLFPQQDIK